MRSLIVAVIALAATTVLPSPAQAQVAESMTELIGDWEATFNKGDGAAVAAMYTEDAVRFPPEQEAQKGREAIAADIGNYEGISIKLKVVGSLLEGDVGTSWGFYELTGQGEDGEDIRIAGRWMNALKMTDEGWKIHRDS